MWERQTQTGPQSGQPSVRLDEKPGPRSPCLPTTYGGSPSVEPRGPDTPGSATKQPRPSYGTTGRWRCPIRCVLGRRGTGPQGLVQAGIDGERLVETGEMEHSRGAVVSWSDDAESDAKGLSAPVHRHQR